jgi:hypothetical protein
MAAWVWSFLMAFTGSSETAGQGADLASACTVRLADLIADHHRYDDQFCAEVDRQLWALAEPVCWRSNTMQAPPAPHIAAVVEAASSDQAVADAFAANMAEPVAMHAASSTEEAVRAFLTTTTSSRPASTGV